MSLGRLLATGRSLGGGPSVGRYNVSGRNRLPKFGSTKNPFSQSAAKATYEQATLPNVSSAGLAAPAAVPEGAGISPADLKETQRLPAMARIMGFHRVTQRVVLLLKRVQAPAVAVALKLHLLAKSLWGRVMRVRRKEPRPLIPRFGKPAVQAELSLDNVKVVCSDLEESDLEVVTVQTNTSTQVAPSAAPATSNRGPLPPALKKLTNRMLGVKPS